MFSRFIVLSRETCYISLGQYVWGHAKLVLTQNKIFKKLKRIVYQRRDKVTFLGLPYAALIVALHK